MITLREVDPAEFEWEEDCMIKAPATRTIAMEASEEYVAEDCYEVYAVKTTTLHYDAVGAEQTF